MLIIALLCASFVALLHFYIAYLEIPAYGQADFRRIFKVAPQDLATLQATFNNLGIYNLAQAVFITLGVVLHMLANSAYLYGMANGLLFATLGTVTGAGCYLFATNPNKRRAAIFQASPAFLAMVFLALA